MGTSIAKGSDVLPEVEGSTPSIFTVLLVIFSIVVGIWFIRSSQSSVASQGYQDPAIPPTLAVLLIVGMYVLGVIGASLGMLQLQEGEQESLLGLAWITVPYFLAQIPVVLAYAMLRRRCGSRNICKTTGIGLLVFVPLALSVAGLIHMLCVYTGLESPEKIGHDVLKMLADQGLTPTSWTVIICVTLGAGITEEVMYRGLVLPTLVALFGRKTPWMAIVVTSALFTIMHGEVATYSAMAGLFVLSFGLCWARIKSGGILAPIAIHVLFNTMNIAIVYSTTL